MVEKHAETRTLVETIVVPAHIDRVESDDFRQSKETLRKDKHYECFVCGSKDNLEVHHFGAPWAMADDVDFNKLKDLLSLFDIYGYSKSLRKKPITTIDDVRNMLVLCKEHHNDGKTDGVANGIHNISFPAWIMQKVKKDNSNPVPLSSAELQEEIKRE
jgi:hypothetical protein